MVATGLESHLELDRTKDNEVDKNTGDTSIKPVGKTKQVGTANMLNTASLFTTALKVSKMDQSLQGNLKGQFLN